MSLVYELCLVAHALWWNALLALMQSRGALSCLNLVFQASLTPHGRPYPFGGVDRGVWEKVGVDGRRGERGNCDWDIK